MVMQQRALQQQGFAAAAVVAAAEGGGSSPVGTEAVWPLVEQNGLGIIGRYA